MVQCILMGYAYSLKAHPPALWSCCVLPLGVAWPLKVPHSGWIWGRANPTALGSISDRHASLLREEPGRVFRMSWVKPLEGEAPLPACMRSVSGALLPSALLAPLCCCHSNVDGGLWKERGGEIFQTFVSIFFWIEWEIYTKILFAFWVLLILGSWRN